MGKKIKEWMGDRLIFYCPGCKHKHVINRTWQFDENFYAPTISPSILVTMGDVPYRCHSYIRNGKIEFLMDCTHELKGQTVPLPDCPGSEPHD